MNILYDRRIVGVGDNNGDVHRFQEEAQIGDVVLVRSGAHLIALVELESNAYENPNPDG